MRIKLTLLILTISLLLFPSILPGLVLSKIPITNFVHGAYRAYAPQTTANGIIEMEMKKQVFLSVPVIADSILVSPGDIITKGETLAIIDTQLTKSVLSQSLIVEKDNPSLPSSADSAAIVKAADVYGISVDELMPFFDGTGHLDIQNIQDNAQASQQVVVPEYITSPMDGIVTEVNMESGILTDAGNAVFTVADGNHYIVRANITENQINEINLGDPVRISGPALQENYYYGAVKQIAQNAQRGDGTINQATVEVCIEILNPDSKLKNNYSTVVEITSQNSANLLTLPYEVIQQDEQNREFVYVYEKGRAIKKVVQTGQELPNCVEIISGISPEDPVLCANTTVQLQSGKPVRLGEELL